MAHIIKEDRAEQMSDVAIYVIISPLEEKQFYIARSGPGRMHKVYVEHFNLRVKKTKDMFVRAHEANLLPQMYLLETSRLSKRESFRRCVAWTKYFLEKGYSQTTEDILSEYAIDLTKETAAYYEKIKHEPLEELLQPEGGLFPNYKKRSGKTKIDQDRMIYFRLDDDEYEKVKEKADALELSMSGYSKRMTLNGKVIRPDLEFIGEYLDGFTEVKTLLKQILFSIYTTGNYYPADIKNIQTCIEHVTEIQKNVHDEITEMIHNLRE